uniref:NADH dehydrogenase subunit 2 n=1 Tax=Uvitellina sp. SSS-2019 TaxID=2587434 RepID=A0A4Y5RCT7_9TREM|nr:NADH dehydrogenase subunit 2 [Uvitellina sp. SSS-2019]QCY72816.1 NADH dehydrogenase subunit 2 [Uvitellina sp. SSS-2019]
MRGVLLFVLSISGLFAFSILICASGCSSFLWIFLELLGLCVVPCFFLSDSDSLVLSSLFNYVVISSVSSSLVLCGLVEEVLIFLLVLGFLIKFGLFPFWGWVYNVGLNSNWLVLWALSTFLKVPIFIFPFFLSVGDVFFVSVLCSLSFFFLSFLFWVYTYSWFHCWCHIMLSSSASFLVVFSNLSFDVLFYLVLFYFFWSTLVVWFFSIVGSFSGDSVLGGVGFVFFFVFLLISVPFSVSIFYKILMAVSIFCCSSLVIGFWVLYCISEQFYLVKYVVSSRLPKKDIGVFSVL